MRRANDGERLVLRDLPGATGISVPGGARKRGLILIGDGALNYGPETVWESYYSAQVFKWFWVGPDFQRIVNPAYNRDRGPLWAESLRLHMELNKDMLPKRH